MSTAAVKAATEITSENVQMKSHMWLAPIFIASFHDDKNILFAYLSFACCSKFVSARCRNRETSKYLVEQCDDLSMSTEVFTSFLQITDSKGDIVSGAEISVCNVGTTTLRHQPWPQKNSLMKGAP